MIFQLLNSINSILENVWNISWNHRRCIIMYSFFISISILILQVNISLLWILLQLKFRSFSQFLPYIANHIILGTILSTCHNFDGTTNRRIMSIRTNGRSIKWCRESRCHGLIGIYFGRIRDDVDVMVNYRHVYHCLARSKIWIQWVVEFSSKLWMKYWIKIFFNNRQVSQSISNSTQK